MGYAREFLAVALAEMRSARRLVRTWLFAVLSVLIGLAFYLYFTAIHAAVSNISASVGVLNPRFIMAAQGSVVMVIFLVAVIFLAFDIRARDSRERMAEVLDARPLGNLTLLAGRMAGLVFIAWLAVFLVVLSWQGLGALALALDWPGGAPVEPRSVLAFLLLDTPPALVLWCSLVIFLAMTVRNRLLVALLALGLTGAWLWGAFRLPIYLQPATSGQATAASFPSDLVPFAVPVSQFAQRACQLLLAGAFLALAAGLHPRPDGRKPLRLSVGLTLAALGCVGISLLVWRAGDDRAQQLDWLAAHEARQDDPRPRLQAVAGTVGIAPDEQLTLNLDYELAPQGEGALLFSLNPGMRVTALRVEGAVADFTHDDGLLEVALPPGLRERSTLSMSVAAAGVPLPAFAYLDSATDVGGLPANDSVIVFLGTEASIFDPSYVALMPGVFWMPLPGAAAGREDPSRYRRDYFRIDLAVEVPESWLVAGPGPSPRARWPVPLQSSGARAGGRPACGTVRAQRHRGSGR